MGVAHDYYHILGVPRTTSADGIKRQYRKLALEFHPDRNKTSLANEKFKKINEAYDVLSDPQKKYDYDQYGHTNIRAPHHPTYSEQNFTYKSYKPGFMEKSRRVLHITKKVLYGIGMVAAVVIVSIRIATWFL